MNGYIPSIKLVFVTPNKTWCGDGYGDNRGYGKGTFMLEEEAEGLDCGVWKLLDTKDSMHYGNAEFSELALEKLRAGHKFHLPQVSYNVPPFWYSNCVEQLDRLVELLEEHKLWGKLPSSGGDGGSQDHRIFFNMRRMIAGYYALAEAWRKLWNETEYCRNRDHGPDYPDSGGMKMVLCHVSDLTWFRIRDLVPDDVATLREEIKNGKQVLWAV